MAQDHRIQHQRFELKYFVRQSVALAVRDFLGSYLELDDFSRGKPGLAYPVHSLYLDSNDLDAHYATVNGNRNRYKLRLRYYDASPDAPVFFEFKGRRDNCVLKHRCGVARSDVKLLLGGQMPDSAGAGAHSSRDWFALQHFQQLQLRFRSTPRAHSFYLREAWVSRSDNSVRVNFDRNIQLEPCFASHPVVSMTKGTELYPGWVVLELKFSGRFPNWFRALVETFNLMQASASKYSDGVTALGEWRFQGRSAAAASAPIANWKPTRHCNVQPGIAGNRKPTGSL